MSKSVKTIPNLLHLLLFVPLSSGVGRTGAFCLLYAALQELEAGNGILDLPLLVKKMRQQRKNMLQEKVRRRSQDGTRNFKIQHFFSSDLPPY